MSTTRYSIGLSDASGGKGQEHTQMIATAIGTAIPTAPPSITTRSRSRPVPTRA